MPFDMGGVGKKFLILDELDKVRANRERLRKKNHLRKGRSAPRAIERRLEEILSRESVNLSGSNANLSDIYLLADVALDKRSSAQERILDFRYVLERVDLGVQELQVAKRMYGALKDHFYKDALHMKKSGIPEFKRDLNVMSDNLKGGEKEAYWMDHGISSEEEFAAVKAELKFRYDSVKSKGTVEFTWGEKDQIKQEIYRAKIKGIEHVDEVVRKWNAILKRRERYQERRSWKVEHAISTNRIIDEVEGMLDERLRKVTEAKRHQAALEERRMEVLDRAIEGYQKFLSSPDNQAIDVKKLNGLINALTGKNVRTWDKRLNGVQGAIDGIYTLRELEVAKGLVAYEQSKYQRSSRSKSKSQTLDVFNRIQGDLSSRIEAQEKIREDRRMAKYGKTEPKGSFARLDAWAEGYKEQNRIDDVRERRLTIKNEVTKPTGSFKAFNVKAIEYESQEKQRIENIREQRRLAEAVALRRAQETVKLRGELYQANDLVKRVLQEYEMEIVPAHNELKARIQVSSNVNDLLDICKGAEKYIAMGQNKGARRDTLILKGREILNSLKYHQIGEFVRASESMKFGDKSVHDRLIAHADYLLEKYGGIGQRQKSLSSVPVDINEVIAKSDAKSLIKIEQTYHGLMKERAYRNIPEAISNRRKEIHRENRMRKAREIAGKIESGAEYLGTFARKLYPSFSSSLSIAKSALSATAKPILPYAGAIARRSAYAAPLVAFMSLFPTGKMENGVDWVLENGRQGYYNTMNSIVGRLQRNAALRPGGTLESHTLALPERSVHAAVAPYRSENSESEITSSAIPALPESVEVEERKAVPPYTESREYRLTVEFKEQKIMGQTNVPKEAWVGYILARKPEADRRVVLDIVDAYYRNQELEGVNASIAIAQAIQETGYFTSRRFKVDNNPCGLGAYSDDAPGMKFETKKQGAHACTLHLRAYATPKGDPEHIHLDPLFKNVQRGIAPTLSGLTGTWAMDPEYHLNITLSILNPLFERLFPSDKRVSSFNGPTALKYN